MRACSPKLMCWILTPVPFHTSSQLLAGGASGFRPFSTIIRGKRPLLLESPAENTHTQPTRCLWSNGVREAHRGRGGGVEDKRDVETEEETCGSDKTFNRYKKSLEHTRLERPLYLLLVFTIRFTLPWEVSVAYYYIFPVIRRRSHTGSHSGIRKSL